MPRGRKKTHKGGHRQFTSELDLASVEEKARKEREWRAKKGIESDDDDEENGDKPVSGTPGASAAAATDLPKSSDESEEEDGEDASDKPKGVQHLIEIENPNHVVRKAKKVTELESAEASLSRREKEELEKQRAKEHYQKLHLAGKTDEARADLARLALIRKQREDAQKKRDEERKTQEDAKTAAEKRLLEKKSKSAGDT